MDFLVKKQGKSSVYDLSLLKNEKNVYIMDNHMAAGWCWAQEIELTETYNLMHIDKHYDLLNGGTENCVSAITDCGFDLSNSTIQEYCNLTYPKTYQNENNQIFRFAEFNP